MRNYRVFPFKDTVLQLRACEFHTIKVLFSSTRRLTLGDPSSPPHSTRLELTSFALFSAQRIGLLIYSQDRGIRYLFVTPATDISMIQLDKAFVGSNPPFGMELLASGPLFVQVRSLERHHHGELVWKIPKIQYIGQSFNGINPTRVGTGFPDRTVNVICVGGY
jgi:hypothetical protein